MTEIPAPVAESPLRALVDCHRTMQSLMQSLREVSQTAGPLDPAGRETLQRATDFFAIETSHHGADEEESLFPRLRRAKQHQLNEKLDALVDDHEEMRLLHAEVHRIVRAWIATGALHPASAPRLHDALARLSEIGERHVAVEEQDIFPAASRLLDHAALAEIASEMRARRMG